MLRRWLSSLGFGKPAALPASRDPAARLPNLIEPLEDRTLLSAVNLTAADPYTSAFTNTLPALVGDVDDDGDADIILADADSISLQVLENDGAGNFATGSAQLLLAGTIEDVALGDFNNDGSLDVVGIEALSGQLFIALADGNGGFLTAQFLTSISPGSFEGITTGDFDGNGAVDIAVAENFSSLVGVRVIRNTGLGAPGGFVADTMSSTSASGVPTDIVAGMFDDDGRLDLAIATSDNKVSLFRNDISNGMLLVDALDTGGTSIFQLAAGDLEKDGVDDLLITDTGADPLVLYIDDDGPTEFFGVFTGTSSPYGAFADLDGDGNLDVLTDFGAALLVYNGNGDRETNFFDGATFDPGFSPLSLATADFNNDGKVDVVTTDGGTSVAVLFGANLVPSVFPVTFQLSVNTGTDVYLHGLEVADLDANGQAVALTIAVDHGVLQVKDDVAGGLGAPEIVGNGTNTVVLTGTVAKINATLANLHGLQLQAEADYVGDALVELTIDDLGHTGLTGQRAAQALSGFFVTYLEIDAPVELPPTSPRTMDAGTTVTLTASDLPATDPDDDPADIVYTTTSAPLFGVLTLNGVPLMIGETFTQEDVDNGLLQYQNTDLTATSDDFSFAVSDQATAAVTTRISLTDAGGQANGKSTLPVLSTDGRYLAFVSDADDLVANDTNNAADVFVRDLLTGDVFLASIDEDGDQATQGNGTGTYRDLSISADGRYIAFITDMNGLESSMAEVEDNDDEFDVYVIDGFTGEVTRVTEGGGVQGPTSLQLAGDGTWVVFSTDASNLVPGDDGGQDVFLYDILSDTLERIGQPPSQASNGNSFRPTVSEDGVYTLFLSDADNIVSGDTNGFTDLYLYNDVTRTTQRVSFGVGGAEPDAAILNASLAEDGTRIVFVTAASNIVVGDTNGVADVFVLDLTTNTTTRVSVDPDGNELADASGGDPDSDLIVTRDGLVIFETNSDAFVVGDANGLRDVVAYDLTSGARFRVSQTDQRGDGNGPSFSLTTLGSNRYIAYASDANNLVPGDTNNGTDVFLFDLGQRTGVAAFTIDPANDPPVNTLPTSFTPTEDLPAVISGLAVSDPDAGSGDIEVVLSVLHGTLTIDDAIVNGLLPADIAGNGTAQVTLTGTLAEINTVLSSSQGVTYLSDADYSGDDTLSMQSDDLGLTGAGGAQQDADTFDFTVAAVNDPPLNTLPTSFTPDEDVAAVISGLAVSDPDAGSGDIEVVLSVLHGTLTIDAAVVNGLLPADIAGNGTAQVTLKGTLAQINTVLASSQGVTYLADANYNGADTLSVQTDDQGLTGTGGALQDSDTFDFTVAAVNDPPVNTLPTTPTPTEDASHALVGLGVADPDAGSGVIQVVLSVQNGRLTIDTSVSGGLTSSDVSGNGTSQVTLTGTLAQLNTVFQALQGVVYRPTANFNGADQLQMTTSDLGLSGGPAQQDSDSLGFTVDSVNDPPVIDLSTNVLNTPEDTAVLVGGFGLSDPDAGSGIMTLTLSSANGTLYSTAGGATVPPPQTIAGAPLVLTGTLAQLNALIAGNFLQFVPVANFNGQTTISIRLDDNGNSGVGDPEWDTATQTVNVGAVNDLPTLTPPGTLTVAEDGTLNIAGLRVADVDSGTALITYRLSVAHGALTINGNIAGGVPVASITNNGSGDVLLTGSVAQINTTLSAINAVRYAPDADYNGADTLYVEVNDQGATGSGGPQTNELFAPITVTAVNDAPVIQIAAGALSVAEDGSLTIPGLSVQDVDAGQTPITVVLSVTHGTLTIRDNVLNGVPPAGIDHNGTNEVTLVGTADQIDRTLKASLGVVYRPDLNYNGSDTLTAAVSDNGATGGTALSDSAQVGINVTPVNDPPSIQIPAGMLTVAEDGVFILSGVTFSDVDDAGQDVLVEFTIPAGRGTLAVQADVAGGLTAAGITGNGTRHITLTGTLAEINATLAHAFGLQLTPPADFFGNIALAVKIDDQATAGGGSQVANASATIGVLSVNDPPSITFPGGDDVARAGVPFPVTGIVLSDVEASGGQYTVTLMVTQGTLTIRDDVANGLTAGDVAGNGTATVVLTGTLAEINATLADATGVIYTASADALLAEVLTIMADDGGAGGVVVEEQSIDVASAAITAYVENGKLYITGGPGPTAVTLTLLVNGIYLIGAPGGTYVPLSDDVQVVTIQGKLFLAVAPGAVTDDISITTDGNKDLVRIVGASEFRELFGLSSAPLFDRARFFAPDNLLIATGSGDDRVQIKNADIADTVIINLEADDDVLQFTSVVIGGDLAATGGGGSDELDVADAVVRGRWLMATDVNDALNMPGHAVQPPADDGLRAMLDAFAAELHSATPPVVTMEPPLVPTTPSAPHIPSGAPSPGTAIAYASITVASSTEATLSASEPLRVGVPTATTPPALVESSPRSAETTSPAEARTSGADDAEPRDAAPDVVARPTAERAKPARSVTQVIRPAAFTRPASPTPSPKPAAVPVAADVQQFPGARRFARSAAVSAVPPSAPPAPR